MTIIHTLKHMERTIRSILGGLFLGAVALTLLPIFIFGGIYFMEQRDIKQMGKVEPGDPCYMRKKFIGKGGHDMDYEVRGDRVCILFHQSGSFAYFKTLEDADSATFTKIDGGYFIDRNRVYYDQGNIVVGANPLMFKSVGNGYYTDDVHYFYDGRKVDVDFDENHD